MDTASGILQRVPDGILTGVVVVAVQIKEPAPHRFIFVEPLLKPIIGLPQSLVGPVHAVPAEPLQILRAFLKMGQEIEEVRQIFFADVKEEVRIGSDQAMDEIGAVLCGIEPAILAEQES